MAEAALRAPRARCRSAAWTHDGVGAVDRRSPVAGAQAEVDVLAGVPVSARRSRRAARRASRRMPRFAGPAQPCSAIVFSCRRRHAASKRSTRVGGREASTITRPPTSACSSRQRSSASSQPGCGHAVGVEERQALGGRSPGRRRCARSARDGRGSWTTRAPRATAAAAVPSREPLSTTMTSGAGAERGQRGGQDALGVPGGDDDGDRHWTCAGTTPSSFRAAPSPPATSTRGAPRRPSRCPQSLRGKRCLDVGTYDGFWAFEMERRGAAEVVAVDVLDHARWDWPGDTTDAVDAIGGPKRRAAFESRARRSARGRAARPEHLRASPEPSASSTSSTAGR